MDSVPSRTALLRHARLHVEVVSEEKAAEVAESDAERDELVRSMMERVKSGEKFDPDDALDFVIALGVSELDARLRREGKSGVTVDQLLKAVDGKTRRKSSDAQRELLGALVGGIGQALSSPEVVGELEAGEVEDAEYREVGGEDV